MDESPSTASSTSTSTNRQTSSSLAMWLIASCVGTLALSLLAAHAPPRIRLIGLFAILFGLTIGWLLAWLAEKIDARPSRWLLSISAIGLTLAGLTGCAVETVRTEQRQRVKPENEELARKLLEQMNAQSGEKTSNPFERSTISVYQSYLARRVRQLGPWPSPWPELFWLAESMTAALASVLMANRRLLGASNQSSEQSTVTP